MNVNRVGHMLDAGNLPEGNRPLGDLLDAVLESDVGRAIVSGAVESHPDERVALVVLHPECRVARDIAEKVKRHPHAESDEASAALAAMWQSLGLPPLRVFCCDWGIATQIAVHAADNEAQARANLDRLRAESDDHLAVCIAPGGLLVNTFYRRARER